MRRWYVKARFQEDHDKRAKDLACDYVLEDTSTQVNPSDALPHVIIQVGRVPKTARPDGMTYIDENIVFEEPVSLQTLNNVPGDEPAPF